MRGLHHHGWTHNDFEILGFDKTWDVSRALHLQTKAEGRKSHSIADHRGLPILDSVLLIFLAADA